MTNMKEKYTLDNVDGVYGMTNTQSVVFWLPLDDDANECDLVAGYCILGVGVSEITPVFIERNDAEEDFVCPFGITIYLHEIEKIAR